MATCGSTFMWYAIALLAIFASLAMSQTGPQTRNPENCIGFNATAPCNAAELADTVYCLSNGSNVGFCAAQEAVCVYQVKLDKNGSNCASATKPTSVTVSTTKYPFSSKSSTFNPEQPSINTEHNGMPMENNGENTAARSLQTSCQIILAFGFIAMTYSSRFISLF